MSKAFALRNSTRYWEVEEPQVGVYGRTVLKVFQKSGKIQVFPRVPGSPNGVGRGATIDLEHMSAADREKILVILHNAITNYKVEK